MIDYASGENGLSEEAQAIPETETATEVTTEATEQNTTESATDEYKYVLNTSRMKIHLPDCPSVKQMAEHNKQWTNDSIEDLKNRGYSPCKNCLSGY